MFDTVSQHTKALRKKGLLLSTRTGVVLRQPVEGLGPIINVWSTLKLRHYEYTKTVKAKKLCAKTKPPDFYKHPSVLSSMDFNRYTSVVHSKLYITVHVQSSFSLKIIFVLVPHHQTRIYLWLKQLGYLIRISKTFWTFTMSGLCKKLSKQFTFLQCSEYQQACWVN